MDVIYRWPLTYFAEYIIKASREYKIYILQNTCTNSGAVYWKKLNLKYIILLSHINTIEEHIMYPHAIFSGKILCVHRDHNLFIEVKEKKEKIWLNPMTKAPTPTEKSKKQRDNIKKRHQKLQSSLCPLQFAVLLQLHCRYTGYIICKYM